MHDDYPLRTAGYTDPARGDVWIYLCLPRFLPSYWRPTQTRSSGTTVVRQSSIVENVMIHTVGDGLTTNGSTKVHSYTSLCIKSDTHSRRHTRTKVAKGPGLKGILEVLLGQGAALRQQPRRKRDIPQSGRFRSMYLYDGLKVQVLSARHDSVVRADVRALHQGQHGPSCPVGGESVGRDSRQRHKKVTKNNTRTSSQTHIHT